jgi:hypothetical protein
MTRAGENNKSRVAIWNGGEFNFLVIELQSSELNFIAN